MGALGKEHDGTPPWTEDEKWRDVSDDDDDGDGGDEGRVVIGVYV